MIIILMMMPMRVIMVMTMMIVMPMLVLMMTAMIRRRLGSVAGVVLWPDAATGRRQHLRRHRADHRPDSAPWPRPVRRRGHQGRASAAHYDDDDCCCGYDDYAYCYDCCH